MSSDYLLNISIGSPAADVIDDLWTKPKFNCQFFPACPGEVPVADSDYVLIGDKSLSRSVYPDSHACDRNEKHALCLTKRLVNEKLLFRCQYGHIVIVSDLVRFVR